MIIKQEDVPVEGASVYADLTDLASYALLRNIDLSSYDDTAKESALYIAAQDWIDGTHEFKGKPIDDDQSMKLPTDEVSINADITTANCMTAVQQLQGLLLVEVTSASSQGEIVMTRSKLDKLEKEVEYAEGTSMLSGSFYPTTQADNKLKPYVSFGGGVPMLRV